jgi:hypothetical protein
MRPSGEPWRSWLKCSYTRRHILAEYRLDWFTFGLAIAKTGGVRTNSLGGFSKRRITVDPTTTGASPSFFYGAQGIIAHNDGRSRSVISLNFFLPRLPRRNSDSQMPFYTETSDMTQVLLLALMPVGGADAQKRRTWVENMLAHSANYIFFVRSGTATDAGTPSSSAPSWRSSATRPRTRTNRAWRARRRSTMVRSVRRRRCPSMRSRCKCTSFLPRATT